MKTIKIRKNREFSSRSRVYVKIGENKVHIKGFKPITLPVLPGEEISASHMWTGSNKINYNQLEDDSTILIRPRMGKAFLWIVLVVFLACYISFNITRIKWLILPLVPLTIYIINYITFMSNRYLILEVKGDG